VNVKTIPRTAVDRSLQILRVPLDTTIGVLGRGGKGESVGVMVDQADAAVRQFAGRLLRDDEFQRDARLREEAAAERRRALELRAEAELERRRADTELHDELRSAEERREAAQQRAEEQHEQVEQERKVRTRQAAQATEQRKTAVRKTAARAEDKIEARGKKARLSELDEKADVLEAEANAATAKSEAQRLQRAASEVKATRKSG
jgi:colicin import membrane protein